MAKISDFFISDIKVGGILDLIKRNIELNSNHQRYPKNIEVMELDFLAKTFSVKLEEELLTTEIALAADGKILSLKCQKF